METTSRSSVCVVVEEFELWPPNRSVGDDIAAAGLRARGRGGEGAGQRESGVHCVYVDCTAAYYIVYLLH